MSTLLRVTSCETLAHWPLPATSSRLLMKRRSESTYSSTPCAIYERGMRSEGAETDS